MSLFKRNPEVTERILDEIISLKQRVSSLELEADNLRNKVLRKIQKTDVDIPVKLSSGMSVKRS